MAASRSPLRLIALVAGLACVALGFVGAVLPLMPSTLFFILAAGCFAYASPKLEAWLLSFEFIGRPVRAWRERGAIERSAKLTATGGMVLGLTLYALTKPSGPAFAAGAVVLALCALFIWTRPN